MFWHYNNLRTCTRAVANQVFTGNLFPIGNNAINIVARAASEITAAGIYGGYLFINLVVARDLIMLAGIKNNHQIDILHLELACKILGLIASAYMNGIVDTRAPQINYAQQAHYAQQFHAAQNNPRLN